MSFRNRHISFLALITLIAFLSSTAAMGRSPAAPRKAQGGPDTFGYRWIDNQGPDNPASGGSGPNFTALFEDITSLGTQVFGANVDDSVSGAVSIGFSFPYYGTNYTSLYVSSNSNVHFASPNATLSNPSTFPSSTLPNGVISIFWDDTHTRSGQIRSYMAGTAPNRRFIIHWINTGHFSSASDTYNYQMKLYEDGRIYFLYQSMSGTYASGSSASIGIEDANGTVGLPYLINGSPSTNAISNGRALQFANNIAPNPPTNLAQVSDPGGSPRPLGYVTDSTIYFRGAATDPDGSNTVGIEAEILPSNLPFQTDPTGTLVVTPATGLVPNGQVAEAALDFSTTTLPSGNYHWRARAVDNLGAKSTWVEFNPAPIHFITDFVPPSAPTDPFSPSGVQLILQAPQGEVTFEWGPAVDSGPPGPINYLLELSSTDTFGTVFFQTTTSTTTASPTLQASDTPYYWRVSAIDQAGNQGLPSATQIYQQSWTAPAVGNEDKYANCGAGLIGAPAYSLALAGLAALIGLASRRRS